MEFLGKLPWEPSADLQLEMCYRQAGIVNWRCRWGDRHSGSSVVGVSGWLVPGTGGCSAPAGMVPGRWVCVKAVIAARRRSVPSKRERQAEESSASCLDVLVSGALMEAQAEIKLVTTLGVYRDWKGSRDEIVTLWSCVWGPSRPRSCSSDPRHGPACLCSRAPAHAVLWPHDVLWRLLPEQVPSPHTLQTGLRFSQPAQHKAALGVSCLINICWMSEQII